jgi:hypothetical protein
MTADTALLLGLGAIAFAAVLAVPLIARARRMRGKGLPDFRADRSANDREW